nr:restriction endonuclease subunit S [uncultured Ruminococcus sp.]
MAEWISKTLGELTSFISKGIPPKYVDEENENTIRVLNQKCNRNFEISYNESRIHNAAVKKVPENKLLHSGDVLINSTGTGTAGRVAQIFNIPVPTTVDGHMILLRPTKEIDPLYYGYVIKSYQKKIESLAEGSTGQTEINRQRLQDEIYITFPKDRALQKGIGTFLFQIDEKIKNNSEINNNLLEQALAIYKDWFCDYALSDGILPENWKITTIDAISSLVTRGIAPKYDDSSDQIVLNQKCIRDHTIDISLSRRHLPKKINEKWISKGDLLINSTGTGTLGRVAQVWFEANNMTVDSHVTIVRPKDPILQSYIGFWGLSHESEIEAQHTGSTGQTELPRDRVKAMELPLPDEDTLSKFNELVIPMTSTVISNQEENDRLSQLRDALLPKLMSGELDVSEIDL